MNTRRQHGRIRDELPEEIRKQVDRLLIEGANTYDDIKSYLDARGYDISRSGIGRYGKDFLNTYRRLKVVEDKSRALVSEAGDGMVLEEAASKLFAQMILEAQMDGSLDVTKLPRIISDFARLQASTVLRERLKKEFKNKLDKATEKVAKKKNIDPETLKMIREEVYGLL